MYAILFSRCWVIFSSSYKANESNSEEGSDERFILNAGSNLSHFTLECSLVRRCIEGDTQSTANHLTLALIYHHHHRYYHCYKATVPPL